MKKIPPRNWYDEATVQADVFLDPNRLRRAIMGVVSLVDEKLFESIFEDPEWGDPKIEEFVEAFYEVYARE